MTILKVVTRLTAFLGKELVEVIRRPGAMVSLILGPFLIMAVFGMGYQGFRRPLQTILVIPPQSGLPTDLETYQGVAIGMDIVEVPGATGWYDTDYEGKRDAALRTLAAGADVFVVHVEATDEAGHAGRAGRLSRLAAQRAGQRPAADPGAVRDRRGHPRPVGRRCYPRRRSTSSRYPLDTVCGWCRCNHADVPSRRRAGPRCPQS
jgi:hypothetical protein